MQDFPAFEVIKGDSRLGLVLLGDHASNRLPDEYGSLGLAPETFDRHIAYDIGIGPLVSQLARRLGVPAVMSTYSRLLIDPNRGEDDPTLVMKLSDGAIIPTNHPITAAEIDHRLTRFYRPYHDAVAATISEIEKQSGKAPLVLSLHSFTPAWKGHARPWHAGVLWDGDPRAARPLIYALAASGDIVVGDNEPYDGALRGDTMYKHCLRRGIAHALLEVRQDLIASAEGIAAWAERLEPVFRALNADPQLHQYRIYPSRTGPYDN